MYQILAFAAVTAALFLMWVSLYDTHRFVVTEKKFTSPKVRQKRRYVMLSDLHGQQYGRENSVLLEKIRDLHPDAVLIAGDMLTADKKTKPEPVTDFLDKLCGQYPVYYANGNHEQKIALYPDRYGKLTEKYERALQQAGVRRLINEQVFFPDCGIELYGVEIGHHYFGRFRLPQMPPDYMEKLLGKPQEEAFTILLAHNPDYFPSYAEWGADLVLSGHVHGGIMRLPFLGGVVAPSMRLFPKYDGGEYHEGNSVMVLGRGIGTHSPNVRFFNPGELVVIDLEPS